MKQTLLHPCAFPKNKKVDISKDSTFQLQKTNVELFFLNIEHQTHVNYVDMDFWMWTMCHLSNGQSQLVFFF